MKNAFQIGGVVAAVFAMHLISYKFGEQNGRMSERYGKTMGEMYREVMEMATFVHKLKDTFKTIVPPPTTATSGQTVQMAI